MFRILAVVLVLVFILASTYRIFQTEKRVVLGRGKINLAIEKPLGLLSLDMDDQSATVFVVPEEASVWLPGGMGTYRAGAVSNLSRQEGKGMYLWAQGLMWTMGVGVDGWISESRQGLVGFKWDGDVSHLKKISWWQRVRAVLIGGESSLGFRDRLAIFGLMNQLGEDQVRVINLGKSVVVSKLETVDGEKVLGLNQKQISQTMWQLLRDKAVIDENILIEIENGTDEANLAGRVGGIIRSVGGRVVGEGDAEQFEGLCTVLVMPANKDSFTAKKIVNWFGCELKSEAFENWRSGIKVVLGEKFGEFMTGN